MPQIWPSKSSISSADKSEQGYGRSPASQQNKLRITEVFVSLQGESSRVGLPTVFVRLTGCPLRCQYCDTAYAFSGGRLQAIDELIEQVRSYGVRQVCVTGGEPLAQRGCVDLLRSLCDAGLEVSLETSGALDIRPVDARVKRVVDIKTPGSGECEKNRMGNLDALCATDELKFVICNRQDYDWAVMLLNQHKLSKRCPVLFSPSFAQVSETELADWIIADRLPVRFQTQLHKRLWGDVAGH
ncbi:MAG: 7-carboxy-7-deazaguanine synthase QueE [Panacagrimonas sp.]